MRSISFIIATVDIDPLTDHDETTDSSEPLVPDTTSEHSVELDFLANPSADIICMSENISADDSVSVDSFESQPSSPLITGTNDNNTTTTRTSSNRIRRKVLICCLLSILIAVGLLLFVIGIPFFFTLPDLPSGSVVLGTTNATLLLILDPTNLDQVTFSETEDNFTTLFYDMKCSDVETERYLLDYTRFLDVTEQQYRIDEFYLVKNSTIYYLFTTLETQNSSSCVAMIHIFSNHSNYLQFISAGLAHEANFSYCLSPPLPLNFKLSVSAAEEDQYYFVGLKSFVDTTINYTATGDLLKYNISSLSPTTCTFPTTNCSISLSGREDVCILAQLQETNKFIPLDYATLSQHYNIQYGVYVTEVVSGSILFCVAALIIIYYFIVRRCQAAIKLIIS